MYGFRLPEDFLIGTSSSAFQSEGAWDKDGKSMSVIDHYSRLYAGKPHPTTGRILTEFSDEIVYTRRLGSWICVSLTQYEMDNIPGYYKYCIFAYNDATNTVRYIYSYCQDAGGVYASPYFLTLDWDN